LRQEEINMALQLNPSAAAHIRFEGRSLDVALADLRVSDQSSDREVKQAVARHLELPEVRLHDYVIDRHESGNVTIRPQAVFG
jgi:hypothetical protein